MPYRRYYYPYYYPYPYYYDSQVYREDEYRADDYISSQQQPEEEPYYDRFSDVREKVQAQQAEDAARKERVNTYLDSVTEAFAAGDYAEASSRALDAVRGEPDVAVLPFVYTQSLFAHGRYTRAAAVLREALSNIDPDTREIYYPLGLYPDENLLTEQIEALTNAVRAEPDNADLQLLLGYQLLGADRLDQAREALQQAQNDYVNRDAAATLMEVLEKTPAQDSEYTPVQKPSKTEPRDYY
ncbi:MAG: tetratricopeptide repeat protein [Planctomycetota bacterium]|nr:MAG: tetratricopeptide repeat protein [Planctomycetota bacterium]